MKVRIIFRLQVVAAFLVLLLGCSLNSFATTKEVTPHPNDASTPFNGNGEMSGANDQLWRSFLWEAIPAEWLRDSSKNMILEVYQQQEWTPFFITAKFEIREDANVFLQRLDRIEAEAIDPKPYQLEGLQKSIRNLEKIRVSLNALSPSSEDLRAKGSDVGSGAGRSVKAASGNIQLASTAGPNQIAGNDLGKEREAKLREAFRAASELDIRLMQSLARFAMELNPLSGDAQVKSLLGQVPMADFLASLEPSSPQYSSLLKAYGRYQRLAQTAREPVRLSSTLRPGDSGQEVRQLQLRLQQEGFYDGKVNGSYDSATKEAVKEFQSYHLQDSDGVVGQRTRDWMSVSFKQKAEMIAHSIQLMRQSPSRIHSRLVRINIPEFLLEYYRDGEVQSVHRVIVGKSSGKKIKVQGRWMGENQTPSLKSSIERVVINPRWYVPDRIRLELASDASSLARQGYVQMSSLYPWGESRLFQKPGPTNPLGRVKFEFPNPYAVFLHDTPKEHYFNRTRRDFSHGCVRVERAEELAQLILSDDQNPAAKKMSDYLKGTNQAYISLSQAVPIVIEYLPVTANERGEVIFLGDPYGWFKKDPKGKTS
jgi:L,D-transpeptidase YcbB